MLQQVKTWFRFNGTVGRGAYARIGFAAMAGKYALDAGVIYLIQGRFWSPWEYLSPMLSAKQGLDPTIMVYLALGMVPAAWLGLAMSVKRLRDAGRHPFWSLLFLVPLVNYVVMLTLCVLPTQMEAPANAHADQYQRDRLNTIQAVLLGALLGALFGALGVGLLGNKQGSYGIGIFLLVPLISGCLYGYTLTRTVEEPSRRALFGGAVLTFLATNLAVLLFALEGVICLLMVAPINFTMILFGAFLGSEMGRRNPLSTMQLSPLLTLPFVVGLLEPLQTEHRLHAVTSRAEIGAPIESVWKHVVHFSDIPDTPPLLKQFGIAYPLRARIVGEGVGAVRYCEFTTGAFVEPITQWEAPYHLAFSVAQHPPTMEETNPFHAIHPPHLNGYFMSKKGEFRLRSIDPGFTEVLGTTWYEIKFAPEWYWSFLADFIVHKIHKRVLDHIEDLAVNEAFRLN